jgi:hypothetical protein
MIQRTRNVSPGKEGLLENDRARQVVMHDRSFATETQDMRYDNGGDKGPRWSNGETVHFLWLLKRILYVMMIIVWRDK